MSLSQQTSLTFLNAKTQVAEQASKQNTSEYLNRAGRSIQQAVKYWNRHNWRWLASHQLGMTAAAAATSLPMPYNLRDVYDLTATVNGRIYYLQNINRRKRDRHTIAPPSVGEPLTYDLFNQWNTTLPYLKIDPPIEGGATFDLQYYRRMTIPCAVSASVGAIAGGSQSILVTPPTLAGATIGSIVWSTGSTSACFLPSTCLKAIDLNILDSGQPKYDFILSDAIASGAPSATAFIGGDNILLDIPEDFENGILSWATHHFLSSLGAPEGRLRYFITLAEDELQRSLKANEDAEDQDIGFELGPPDPYRPSGGGYI